MSQRTVTSEPKTRAKVVRATLEAAKLLKILAEEAYEAGEDLDQIWHTANRASETMLQQAIIVPGVRIAVFPSDAENTNSPKP